MYRDYNIMEINTLTFDALKVTCIHHIHTRYRIIVYHPVSIIVN